MPLALATFYPHRSRWLERLRHVAVEIGLERRQRLGQALEVLGADHQHHRVSSAHRAGAQAFAEQDALAEMAARADAAQRLAALGVRT